MKPLTRHAGLILCLLLAACSHPPATLDRQLAVSDIEIQNDEVENALPQLVELNQNYPNNPAVLLRLARIHEALGRETAAIEFYKKIIAINHDSKDGWMGLVKIYMRRKPETALTILENMVKLYPDDPHIVDDYGVALDLNGHYTEAQNEYKRAIQIDPSMVSPEVNLGLSIGLSGDISKGLAIIKPYAVTGDATPRTRENYALLLIAAGRTEDAKTVLISYLPPDAAAAKFNKLTEFWTLHADDKKQPS